MTTMTVTGIGNLLAIMAAVMFTAAFLSELLCHCDALSGLHLPRKQPAWFQARALKNQTNGYDGRSWL